MKNFILKLIQFFMPFLIILFIAFALYERKDVYNDFTTDNINTWKYSFQILGDLSTKKLISSTTRYNSFILGSSRTCSVHACYLQKKIPNSSFFHYASWNETIGGIYAKLELLDLLGYKIENVFIYLDTDYTFFNDGKCPIPNHYLLTKKNKYLYLFDHFKNYYLRINTDKFKILLGIKVNDKTARNVPLDSITNDFYHHCSDSTINFYGVKIRDDKYLKKTDSLIAASYLYDRSDTQKYAEKQISEPEIITLMKIRNIFKKHNTNYYIAIAPLYDQLKFHPSDMAIINKVFGKRVFDFSGINKITQDKYNYYDRKHFQNSVSKIILDSIILVQHNNKVL